jgi:lanthanide-dependent methanol dehydrogenase
MSKFVNIAGAARVLAVASLVCSVAQAQTPQPPSFAKATDDGQWTMPAKDAASTRYSSLDEINAQNVKNLKVAFAFSTGLDRGEEAAPLVVGDAMYIVTPYPNTLFAFGSHAGRRIEMAL